MLILDLRFIGSRIPCWYGGLGLQSPPAIQGLCVALGLLAARLRVSQARKWWLHPQAPLPSPRGQPHSLRLCWWRSVAGADTQTKAAQAATSQGPRQSLRLKGLMGEAANRAASLLANSQHLCHSKSGYKLSQIQPTTQSPQNPRALRIHLPADPETPDKPSVHTAIF